MLRWICKHSNGRLWDRILMEPKDNVHMGKAREVILVLISCFVIL